MSKQTETATGAGILPRKQELPPTAFSNCMATLGAEYTLGTYKLSNEWKAFIAGYNAAVEACNDSIKSKYNMGQIKERLFQ